MCGILRRTWPSSHFTCGGVHSAGVVWQHYGSVRSVLCQFYASSMAALDQFYGSVRSVLCQFYVRGYAPGVAPVWLRPQKNAKSTQPRPQNYFFVIAPPPWNFFMGEAAESRLTQLHEGNPGLTWWRDRAVRLKFTSGASATGPVSRRATSVPSHRADEPPGPQAPGKQARIVHTDRTDCSGRGA